MIPGVKLSIALILGTPRIGRRSELVAQLALSQLSALPHVRANLLDLAELQLPILEERNEQSSTYPIGARTFRKHFAATNAILFVTPEYKNSFPGALKNALDFLPPDAFRRRPVGIITVSSGALG